MSSLPVELIDLTKEAVSDLCESIGAPFPEYRGHQDETIPPPHSMHAIIGFAGTQIKGSLAISADNELIKMTHPNGPMGMPVTEDDLPDWLGELANQLLGRLKNMLLRRGVDFGITTPSVFIGKAITTIKRDAAHGYEDFLFDLKSDHFVALTLQTIIKGDLDLSAKDESAADMTEGDTLFF